MANGFIPIRRTLFRHFLFNEHRVFSRFEAWLDLIQLASFTDGQTDLIKGKVVTRNRGEIIASLRWIASRWNWSIHKTSDFIEVLRSQDMVVVDKENGITKLSLVSFEKHNSFGKDETESAAKDSKRNGKTRTGKGFDRNQGTQKENQTEPIPNSKRNDETHVHAGFDENQGTQKGTVREQRGDSEGTNNNKENTLKKENGGSGAHAPPSQGDNGLKEKQTAMAIRQKKFSEEIATFGGKFLKGMLREFFIYWSEPNKSQTKMKFEMESTWDLGRRLSTWETRDAKWNRGSSEKGSTPAVVPPVDTLKVEKEINFLYSRFLEGELTEVINIQEMYYDKLKQKGKITFFPEQVDEITKTALTHIEDKKLEADEFTKKRFMKKYAVLEFFRLLKITGAEAVFNEIA